MPGSWSSGWECSPPDRWGDRAIRGAPAARVRCPRGVHALAYAGLVSSSGKRTEWGSCPLGCFGVFRDTPPAPASRADTRGPAGAVIESGVGVVRLQHMDVVPSEPHLCQGFWWLRM